MSLSCKRCIGPIPRLAWSKDEIEQVTLDIRQRKRMHVVKWLVFSKKMSHLEAKSIVSHFNAVYGQCHRCNNDALEGDHLECPKCKAFNYNLAPRRENE